MLTYDGLSPKTRRDIVNGSIRAIPLLDAVEEIVADIKAIRFGQRHRTHSHHAYRAFCDLAIVLFQRNYDKEAAAAATRELLAKIERPW